VVETLVPLFVGLCLEHQQYDALYYTLIYMCQLNSISSHGSELWMMAYILLLLPRERSSNKANIEFGCLVDVTIG
jgi:hypothetical protein